MDKAKILILGNDPNNTSLKTVYGDLQEYSGMTIKIGDYTFNITKRLFIDFEPLINMEGYLKIENLIYKILDIKSDSDYQELLLYLCNRQSVVV